ncbi:MAG: MATE family efflux transporter [Clostridia bacterium]|nr:MATE family efflux transporter [Clostridia bacterium]
MQKMTQGSIPLHLIRYAIPMILGNLLQLTYNAVDSMIIGKCLGENALAAVSTSNPIMTIIVLGVSGLSMGASVLMSRFYGANDTEKVRREFATSLLFSIFCSLIVFLLGFVFSNAILRAIHTPEVILPEAGVYLRVMFFGFLLTFLYNLLAAAMRSLGDSRTPLISLSVSCILNILLDLLFVAVLHMGVFGAAFATVLSQLVSVLTQVILISRRMPILRLTRADLRMDPALLRETLSIGSLTALQQSAQPIGKVLIQSVINAQGVLAIGAFNAVCRIDDFACIPAQSIGSAIMTCTAQNRGGARPDRCRETFRKGLLIAVAYFPIICSLTLLFRRSMISALTPDKADEMIRMGTSYLSVKAWFFIMPCITNSIQGFFRGMTRMRIVLFSTVLQISIRTVFVFFLVPRIGITGEAFACFIGWLVMAVWEFAYYFAVREKMYQSIESSAG